MALREIKNDVEASRRDATMHNTVQAVGAVR